MNELHIVDHDEWWITRENGYGEHEIVRKFHEPAIACGFLNACRTDELAVKGSRPEWSFACYLVKVHRTAAKLEW